MGLLFCGVSCGKGPEREDSLKKEEAFIHYELGMDYYGIGEQQKAMDEWRRAVELDPDSEAHHMIGHDHFLKGEFEAAEREWLSMLSKNNANPMILNNLGNLYKAWGKEEMAMEYYHKALQINPELSIAHYNIGAMRLDKGAMEEARENFSKVLALDPQMAIAVYQMGNTLLREGKQEAAKSYFKKLAEGEIREDPGFNARLAGYSSLGKLCLEEKNFEEAEKYFLKGLEIAPLSPELRYGLGNAYEHQKKTEKAEQEYRKILKDTPGFPYAYNGLGNLYAELGKNLEEAEKLLLVGVQIDPKLKPHFLDSLGWVYYKQGKIEEALSKVREAIALTPPDEKENLASKYHHLGMIHKAKGDNPKAKESFRKAAEFDPAAERAPKARESMR